MAAALCLVAVSAGSAQADEYDAPASETDLPSLVVAPPRGDLRVGERLSFHGRWMGIPVGFGWIEVKARVPFGGGEAYYVEAEGRSNAILSKFYPIHDVIRSYLDVESLRPLQFEKIQQEGQYRADEIVTFDYDRLIATYHSRLNQSTKEVPIPPDVHDIVSAFYWLRTKLQNPAEPVTLPIYSDEKVYKTALQPLKSVTLELRRRGSFPSLLIEPEAKFKGILVRRGRMWIYVTADERRIPLLVKLSTPWGMITGVISRESLKPHG